MIKGLSTAGIGHVSIEELVQLAADNGFGAIDTSGQALRELKEKKGLEGARQFLKENKVIIGSIGLPVEWRQSDDVFSDGLAALIDDAKIAKEFDCTSCCTYVLPSTDYKAAHFMTLATKRLRLCAQILNNYGINLGLEFVGPHHLRTTWANPFIWEMQEMLDWIEAIAEPNVGLLLDSFHWHTTSGSYDDLVKIKPSQIVHVHLNDARALPVEEVLDNDRLYPGEGAIDLPSFLKALKQIGYKGVVAQEILTKEPPSESPEVLAQKSGQAFRQVFESAEI